MHNIYMKLTQIENWIDVSERSSLRSEPDPPGSSCIPDYITVQHCWHLKYICSINKKTEEFSSYFIELKVLTNIIIFLSLFHNG